jgi:hypothetical protein
VYIYSGTDTTALPCPSLALYEVHYKRKLHFNVRKLLLNTVRLDIKDSFPAPSLCIYIYMLIYTAYIIAYQTIYSAILY